MFDLPYASLSPSPKLDIYWPSKGNGHIHVVAIADAFATRYLDPGELIGDTRPAQADSQSMKLLWNGDWQS
jgi:hypothetical protein